MGCRTSLRRVNCLVGAIVIAHTYYSPSNHVLELANIWTVEVVARRYRRVGKVQADAAEMISRQKTLLWRIESLDCSENFLLKRRLYEEDALRKHMIMDQKLVSFCL